MFKATVIEWVRPNADKRERSIELPDELLPQYEAIQEAGCNLAMEDCRAFFDLSIWHPEVGDVIGIISGQPTVLDWTKLLGEFTPDVLQGEIIKSIATRKQK